MAAWPHTLVAARLAGALFAGAAAPALGLDFAQAWRLAQDHDLQLRAARAQTLADRERVPQARSRLLPNLSAQFTRHRNDLATEGPDLFGRPSADESNYSSHGEVLLLRLPIYRRAASQQLQQAGNLVAASEAQLQAKARDLLDRAAKSYLQVLLAQDQIDVIQQQQRAYRAQLDAATRSLSAGRGTRTDIDEARARHDLAVADELALRQALDLALRELQVLIGQAPSALARLDAGRMGTGTDPGVLDQLVAVAQEASPELAATREQIEAARRDVEIARSGHYPTLDAIAQYSRTDSENVTRVANVYRHGQIGLVLNVPLYQGGLVNSQVREALARLDRAEVLREGLVAELGMRVHRAYRGVSEGEVRMRALEQAVRSAEQAALSSERSFTAGYRTRVDILNAQGQEAAARRDLAQARYEYLLARLRLGALTGVPDDALVGQLNATLRP